MIFPLKWVPQSLRLWKIDSGWETHFLFLCHCESISLVARESISPSGKHSCSKWEHVDNTYWMAVEWSPAYIYYGGQRNAKNEKWGLPGSQKKPSGCLGFPRALTVRFIYSHGLPALGADCCFRGHQDDKSRAMKG